MAVSGCQWSVAVENDKSNERPKITIGERVSVSQRRSVQHPRTLYNYESPPVSQGATLHPAAESPVDVELSIGQLQHVGHVKATRQASRQDNHVLAVGKLEMLVSSLTDWRQNRKLAVQDRGHEDFVGNFGVVQSI